MNRGVFGFPGNNGLGTIAETTTYNSASGSWTKPGGYDDQDTVLIRMWGGGGSGAASTAATVTATGGGGGAFSEFSYLYGECPSTIDFVVGAGGTSVASTSNGASGGDSYITASGTEIIRAKGGVGGVIGSTGSAGGVATFITKAVSPAHYNGGKAGDSGQNGESSAHGGAGGGTVTLSGGAISSTTNGGASIIGGNGGAGAVLTAPEAGAAPGGGGGGYARDSFAGSSGAGGAGRIEFMIIRGRHKTALSWFV